MKLLEHFISNKPWYSFGRDLIDFFKRLYKYNASFNTDQSQKKFEYTLLRQCHVIEKGLSMRMPHKFFGLSNAEDVSKKLLQYQTKYGDSNPSFITYPTDILRAYLTYAKENGWDSKEITSNLEKLNSPFHSSHLYGFNQIDRKDIPNQSTFFETFLKTRHSIRYYKKDKPAQELLNKALQMAQLTPSACNRQCWKVHQFDLDNCTKLLKWQEGARGFESEPTVAFLITADLQAFLYYEPFQAYIDGGMYAMSLIYALHSLGLGTIPLSCGFESSKLKKLRLNFNIPENEVPIEIVATGLLQNSFNVAESRRKPISEVIVYHD